MRPSGKARRLLVQIHIRVACQRVQRSLVERLLGLLLALEPHGSSGANITDTTARESTNFATPRADAKRLCFREFLQQG